MSIIIELHRGKRFKSPAGFCVNADSLFPPPSSTQSENIRFYDIWMVLPLPIAADGFIRTHFRSFSFPKHSTER